MFRAPLSLGTLAAQFVAYEPGTYSLPFTSLQLKNGQQLIYKKHSDISVLFSNIYDFDNVSSLRSLFVGPVWMRGMRLALLLTHVALFDQRAPSLLNCSCLLVLFLSQVAAKLQAHDVVSLLNGLFSRFDLVTDQYGVYKVETIGACVSGLVSLPLTMPARGCSRSYLLTWLLRTSL